MQNISALKDRILSEADYEKLWRGRCGRMYTLEAALLEKMIDVKRFYIMKDLLQAQKLYVYGISEDYSMLYYENESGELFEISYNAE